MKTNTPLGWALLCSFLLLHFTAKAQDFPYPGDLSPIYNGQTVDCGSLQSPDQKTFPIWFKVDGKKVGKQPHNKLHNPNDPSKSGSYVSPGSYVDVNFNVNKTIANRYTLVSYSIAPDGTRTIFDYQSNIYNASPPAPPVQGNSNQQLILTPTNCNYEVYWVKGCLVSTFKASGTQDLTTGPVGNPYAYDANGNLLSNNLILSYTFGDAAPNTVCEKCPTVVNGTNNQVSVQLIEVIDLPSTQEKELVFSVINLNGTKVAPLTDYPFIGDVIFAGITPTHTKNNTPYKFRNDHQLGPVLQNYTVPAGSPNPAFGPKDAFVFDQRNNHDILAYGTYQSEIYRFKVSNTEYARLSAPNVSPTPEVCIELSSKHPEPHKTIPPIYCFNINFNCEPCPLPTASITGPDTLCLNNATNYTFTTTAVAGATYTWTAVNATIVSGAGTNTIEVKADKALGAGSVSVTVTNNCGTATDTEPFFVKDCGQACTPIDEECFKDNCFFSVRYNGDVGGGLPTQVSPGFFISNTGGLGDVQSITFSLPTGLTATELSQLNPLNDLGWPASNTSTLLTFTDNSSALDVLGGIGEFVYSIPGNSINDADRFVTVTVNTTTGSHTFVFDIITENEECFLIPLPVELIGFSGKATTEGIALNWVTASEKNNDRFEIERSSDGKHFEKVGEVKGQNSSNVRTIYDYLDKQANGGLSYYRLNQVDLDGTNAHSKVIKVTREGGTANLGIQLIPNPCEGQTCSVQLRGIDPNSSLAVELRDLTGRLVFSKQLSGDQTSFDLPKVDSGAGVYLLSVKNGKNSAFQKVIIH